MKIILPLALAAILSACVTNAGHNPDGIGGGKGGTPTIPVPADN